MFSHKQFNPFFKLVLILTAICLSNCSDKSEYGEASDYVKLGAESSGTDETTTSSSGSGVFVAVGYGSYSIGNIY